MAVTLVIEDGSEVTGANTYANADTFETYCEGRGLSIAAYTDDQKEEAIIRAMDWLEALSWQGAKASSSQYLKWPRSGVTGADDIAVDSDVIPQDVINGLCRAAYEELIDAGTLLKNVTRGDKVKREKVGPIEMEYADFKSDTTEFRGALAHVEQYLTTAPGQTLLRV